MSICINKLIKMFVNVVLFMTKIYFLRFTQFNPPKNNLNSKRENSVYKKSMNLSLFIPKACEVGP